MTVEKADNPNTFHIYDDFKWPGTVPQLPWNQLTERQKQVVQDAWRFASYRPGTYQGVTGDTGRILG